MDAALHHKETGPESRWDANCRSGFRTSYPIADPSTYAVAAFWAAAKTSRADVVPRTCSVC